MGISTPAKTDTETAVRESGRRGIRDRVAVAGVGCTRFGERFDASAEDLIVDAVTDAVADAGITMDDIQAAWVGVFYDFTGRAGNAAADPLKLYGRPVTRVENYCASGMDAFRNACLAVASGVYDIVLACGVEKILDQGSRGLPNIGAGAHPVFGRPSAPGMFAMAGTRAFHNWGWDKADIGRVAVKNHANGVHHPKAHFRREVDLDTVLAAPEIAYPLGRFDACAVSDGSAAVIVTTPEIAAELDNGFPRVLVKANALVVQTGQPTYDPTFDYAGFPATRNAAAAAFAEAEIDSPIDEVDLVECHDCFTITELLNIQDMGFCAQGEANRFVADGRANWDGDVAVNASGGLKCFGHPIGATGCRMITEITKQVQGRAEGRQVPDARLGLAHNLGGPGSVCSITILGRDE